MLPRLSCRDQHLHSAIMFPLVGTVVVCRHIQPFRTSDYDRANDITSVRDTNTAAVASAAGRQDRECVDCEPTWTYVFDSSGNSDKGDGSSNKVRSLTITNDDRDRASGYKRSRANIIPVTKIANCHSSSKTKGPILDNNKL